LQCFAGADTNSQTRLIEHSKNNKGANLRDCSFFIGFVFVPRLLKAGIGCLRLFYQATACCHFPYFSLNLTFCIFQ